MDKKELQKQYESVIKEAEKLKEKIDSIPDKKVERWKPEPYEKYAFVDSAGDVQPSVWSNDIVDLFRYNTGNCFKTEEEARDYRENLLTKQQLKDLAIELNNNEELDWSCSNTQKKYRLGIEHRGKDTPLILAFSYSFQETGQAYCLSEKFLARAIKQIGEQKLIKLIKSGV